MQNPYQQSGSQLGRFAFGSRTSAAPAPLFHSTLDDFREEDDVEEHERDVAEYYALQRSRRQVGASHLTESSEGDQDAGRSSPRHDSEEAEDGFQRGRGIRSSWRGESTSKHLKPPGVGTVKESPSRERGESASSKGKAKLVEVELASSGRASEDDVERVDPLEDLDDPSDDEPPAYQQFRKAPTTSIPTQHIWLPRETDEETAFANPRPPSPDRESVPPNVSVEPSRTPRHDAFWANLFFLLLAALFGSFFLSFLHNSPPDKKHPLGDSVYSTLRASFHLLGIDTLVTIIVAVLWLAVLRSALRPLVYLILVAVPIILLSFAIYPLVASFKGYYAGASIQDKLMRFTASVPAVMAVLWIIMNIRSRHAISRAVDILDFGARILEASPTLVLVGFATLVVNVFWLWMWILMFRRIFLGGHFSRDATSFVVDIGTWWLGAFFVIMYLWTQSIIAGIQRATTAATVSQWYFHRNAIPSPTSRAVVQESLKHATSTLFGTICASTLCQLAVRLPLLLLPRRLVGIVTICAYNFFPTPLASLTNPLTLTYAAIHSQPLAAASRGLANLSFVSAMSPTTSLTPASASDRGAPLLPYRLAKLLLHATRYVTSLALGIAGWVSTSHSLKLAGNPGIRGSLYAYVVGIVAAFIGWSILGATEAVMGGIVDAVAVCWGTECAAKDVKVGRGPAARAGYCWEAAELFGEGTSTRR